MKAVFNRHLNDFNCGFTIEFNVKHSFCELEEEVAEYEYATGTFTNRYSDECFCEIMKSKYSWIQDWSFAGRLNGWWVLECNGEYDKIPQRSIHRIESIVEKYLKNYPKRIGEFYDQTFK